LGGVICIRFDGKDNSIICTACLFPCFEKLHNHRMVAFRSGLGLIKRVKMTKNLWVLTSWKIRSNFRSNNARMAKFLVASAEMSAYYSTCCALQNSFTIALIRSSNCWFAFARLPVGLHFTNSLELAHTY